MKALLVPQNFFCSHTGAVLGRFLFGLDFTLQKTMKNYVAIQSTISYFDTNFLFRSSYKIADRYMNHTIISVYFTLAQWIYVCTSIRNKYLILNNLLLKDFSY